MFIFHLIINFKKHMNEKYEKREKKKDLTYVILIEIQHFAMPYFHIHIHTKYNFELNY